MNLSQQQRACILACLSSGRLRPHAHGWTAVLENDVVLFGKATVKSLINLGLIERITSSLHPSRWPARLTESGETNAKLERANELAKQADRLTEEAMAG